MAVKNWKVLSWNVRGINSEKKWNAIRDRVTESSCDILCLQETKRVHFDVMYIRQFCPSVFDSFVFLPSVGASGGSIIIWKSSTFSGSLLFQNSFATSVLLSSLHNNSAWVLTNIYAPCTPAGKKDFVDWFQNVQMPDSIDWLIVGDFNLYRNPSDRNRPGADYSDMLMFNAAISALGLIEIPLKGQRFTWSNKQHPPLLERLDWFFTSPCWTSTYPNTNVFTMTMETSDHVPCLISFSTQIPKGQIFRFENFWLHHEDFYNQVQQGWTSPFHYTDAAKTLTVKFKNLRGALKQWRQSLPSLQNIISNLKLLLTFVNFLEEFRDLSLVEWNFRNLLEDKLISLLKQQKAYWKQRGAIKWVTLGDASTKFFHAQATIKYRRNLITQLQGENGSVVTEHGNKANLIWVLI